MTEQAPAVAQILASPRILLLIFMWSMCALVATKTSNIAPLRWVFVLTTFMFLFRMIPF